MARQSQVDCTGWWRDGEAEPAELEAVKKKKNDQGFHECEVFMASADAGESARTWETCTKNPGHDNFIPAAQFSKSLLPKIYQSVVVMACITNVAKCTARVRIDYTSWDRPDDYAFAVARGTTSDQGKINALSENVMARESQVGGKFMCRQTACHVVFIQRRQKLLRLIFSSMMKRLVRMVE
ncbi:hypothetical protein PoB_006958700 [Plakobranchus ocellatus]|uniref:Uncharacterized protein n=1 Tax=Plakobranchus ocellatus TaxID=259542 RepID=A0AAV4DFT2_9GAST|nr:hypothetical protein PoB_006958700 [Plakobranchus ocellatus]